MKAHTIPPLASLTLVSIGVSCFSVLFAGQAQAAPPASCAIITHGGTQSSGHGVSYDSTTVRTPDGGTTLTVKQMHYVAPSGDETSVQNQADAASLLLVSAMTGHHNAACSDWLQTQGEAVAKGLKAGGTYDLTWSGATIARGTAHVGIGSAHLKLEGSSSAHTSAATLALTGLSFRNVANQDLLPSAAHTAFSLPSSELPALMAAIGGKAEQAPAVHVTISNFDAERDSVHLKGNGTATLTGNVNATSASGHLEITELESLIEKARAAKQMKLAAGLVLARLVSHAQGSANVWNTSWQGGVLTVNGFPLPLK
ncbi:hypothetical protein HK13_02200 [Acetobacter indonesiensis]|nr:hypothetical protein HK13_02200 [Acetobacter indonesiensis]